MENQGNRDNLRSPPVLIDLTGDDEDQRLPPLIDLTEDSDEDEIQIVFDGAEQAEETEPDDELSSITLVSSDAEEWGDGLEELEDWASESEEGHDEEEEDEQDEQGQGEEEEEEEEEEDDDYQDQYGAGQGSVPEEQPGPSGLQDENQESREHRKRRRGGNGRYSLPTKQLKRVTNEPGQPIDISSLYSYEFLEETRALDGVVVKRRYRMKFERRIGFLAPDNHSLYGAAILDMVAKEAPANVGNMKLAIELSAPFDTPLYAHARPIDQYTADFLEAEIRDKMQSARQLENVGLEMEVSLGFLVALSGNGRRNKLNVLHELAKRAENVFQHDGSARPAEMMSGERGTYSHTPVTRYCLGLAIARGIDRLELKADPSNALKKKRVNDWQRLNENARHIVPHLWTRAKELLTNAGIAKTESFTLEDARAIQNSPDLRSRYQLIIFDSETDCVPAYAGPYTDRTSILSLIFFPDRSRRDNSGHFEVLFSIPSFVKASFYCTYCFTKHGSEREHYRCPLKCTKCLSDDCARTGDQKINCAECTVEFSLRECYDRHLLRGPQGGKSRCSQTQRCKDCQELYYLNAREHICGMTYCRACRCIRDRDHEHTLTKAPRKKNYSHKRIFFDLETMEELDPVTNQRRHKVVLACALRVCPKCVHVMPSSREEALSLKCSECSSDGRRYREFDCIAEDNVNVDVLDVFGRWIFSQRHRGYSVVAHNMKGFDGQMLLRYIFGQPNAFVEQLILAGRKINFMSVNGIRFLDSFNYVPFGLAKFSKAFNVPEVTKGEFPFRFIRPENFRYRGPIPDKDQYGFEEKGKEAAERFTRFYEEKLEDAGYVFVFEKEIRDYCFSDVALLAAAMTKFEKEFEELTRVVLFEETVTSAGAAMKTFRRKFIEDETAMALDSEPSSARVKQSAVAGRFLAYLEGVEKKPILREHSIPNTPYRCDGFIEECAEYPKGKAVEFYGCYWHAHSCRYAPTSVIRGCSTADDIRREDAKREAVIRQHCELEVHWECDVMARAKRDQQLQQMLDRNLRIGPVVAREALFGGRTEPIRLFMESSADVKLYYLDFTSLYPFVMKTCPYPTGEGQSIAGGAFPEGITDASELRALCRGYLSCKVLPPRQLFLPVLPYRAEKLLFCLCRTCGEQGEIDNCTHCDDDRALYGTWTTEELELALEKGYKIEKVFGGVHWENWTTTLFSKYINTFLKLKQEASDWPESAKTATERQNYIADYERREGVLLDAAVIKKDEVKRQISKLLLNSLWGKFGQRVDNCQTHIVRDPISLYRLLDNPTLEITNVDIHHVHTVTIQTRAVPGTLQPLNTSCIQYAILTTAHARKTLYKALDLIPEKEKNILYMDTDSVVFGADRALGNPLEELMGSYLGDLTNELKPGCEMTAFVTTGAKTYAYKESDGVNTSVKVKAKGFSMNKDAESKIGFELMERMVRERLAGNDTPSVRVTYHAIQRLQGHILVNKVIQKELNFTFDKRVILADGGTRPFGF